MLSRTRIAATLAALTLLASAASAGYVAHFVESDYQAAQVMKVPKKHSMGMFVPERLATGSEVCIGFQNVATNGNKGKIKGVLEIFRGGQSIGRGNVAGKVRGNFFLKCLFTNAPLEVGDIVIGDVTMIKLATLQVGEPFSVAVVLFPAGAPRQANGRAPKPWTVERHQWRTMSAPAAAEE